MRILGWLAAPEVIPALCYTTVRLVDALVRLVDIVLKHRRECKKIDLRRELHGLTSPDRPSKAVRARHARRRARR